MASAKYVDSHARAVIAWKARQIQNVVYRWTCQVTGKVYIGSSKIARKRQLEHLSVLRNGKHHCKQMQADFNAYGEEVFVFEVLEQDVDPLFLLAREWFQQLRHADWVYEYNVSMKRNREGCVHGNKGKVHTKEHIEKLIESKSAKFYEELPRWREMREQGMSIREIERVTGRTRKMIARMLAE